MLKMYSLKLNHRHLLLIVLILCETTCKSQDTNNYITMNEPSQEIVIREPAVAGQFYAGNETQLRNDLKSLFSDAQVKMERSRTLAVIVPHAGYVYSGSTAASGYIQVDPDKEYHDIFVIGSSHTTYFEGAAIYASGHFKTPLGVVEVDLDLARRLVDQYDVFSSRTDAHATEHSIEVQLPFLQYYLRKPFRIVPIIIGGDNPAACGKIAEALRPYLNDSNLFVISTDFSHYPKYDDAVKVDHETAAAIATNDPQDFLLTISKNESSNIRNLATSICGWTSVLTLLDITATMTDVDYVPLTYRNSGDAPYYGDKTRVVGYYALALSRLSRENASMENDESEEAVSGNQDPDFHLTEKDEEDLLRIARETIESYIRDGKVPSLETESFSEILKSPAGAFVTLHKRGELRGCIGRFNPDIPLYKVVQDMAISAATQDYRFTPVRNAELNNIKIEISVLTPLKQIHSIQEITLGKSGIYIRKGQRSGTYLPQVATSNPTWTVEDFLGSCARDKAGIGWDGWKTAELYTYEALIFEEP